jgi:two-component system, NarL family, nitrate/nitrite response regulator NarL
MRRHGVPRQQPWVGWRLEVSTSENVTMKAVAIAIVDPNQLFREGLQQLLRRPRFTIVAAARTLAEVVREECGAARPDIVVFGCGSEIGAVAEQIAAERTLNSSKRAMRFVFLSESDDLHLLRRAVASGVDSILFKNISSDVLCRSLELVALGQQLFPPALAQAPGDDVKLAQADLIPFPPTASVMAQIVRLDQHKFAKPSAAPADMQRHVGLSERESQILGCLVNGLSNKAIARELHITEATVKVHVKGLLRKTRASNRTQVAIWALNSGLSAEREPVQTREHALGDLGDRRATA